MENRKTALLTDVNVSWAKITSRSYHEGIITITSQHSSAAGTRQCLRKLDALCWYEEYLPSAVSAALDIICATISVIRPRRRDVIQYQTNIDCVDCSEARTSIERYHRAVSCELWAVPRAHEGTMFGRGYSGTATNRLSIAFKLAYEGYNYTLLDRHRLGYCYLEHKFIA